MHTDTVILIVVLLFMFLGLLGTFLPFLPGIPLIFVAVAAYAWYEGFNIITPRWIAFLAGLTVLSVVINYLSAVLGAKHFGSSSYGIAGAFIGAVIGLFILPPLGIFIFPWLGAAIGEYLKNKRFCSGSARRFGSSSRYSYQFSF
ncbi:hypothetical protein SAMN02745221_01514 [Thermosyntropha lipolytica DSM 11003]|uniref:DUF456 domain-containing protein n=1 Tax=Thermosyntropha lipolytica DSM 11003 TaxID=1123382 RepID=A0A1M5PMC7_9FIRM|nr:DUF456 domain-containing protein [Thermosyntropha lipolytica]SHH02846.1 hypothetical protein SAMN02745221_01514 [Thermosyntropha lipolytica DSM 11003]